MDLNPKYLRLEPSKRLIDFSFDLEKLTTIVKDNSIMFYEPEDEKEKKNEFMEGLIKHAEGKSQETEIERDLTIVMENKKENHEAPENPNR